MLVQNEALYACPVPWLLSGWSESNGEAFTPILIVGSMPGLLLLAHADRAVAEKNIPRPPDPIARFLVPAWSILSKLANSMWVYYVGVHS